MTTIVPVELDNTFDEWRTKTNQLIVQGEQALVSITDLYNRSNTIAVNGNTSYNIANAGYAQANTARDHANTAHFTGNSSFTQANTARSHANTAHITANASFLQANIARTHANAAFEKANTVSDSLNVSIGPAFNQANTARIHANAAFLQANTARTLANTATNLSAGGAGQVPYQSATGVTAYVPAGTSGQVLISKGTSAPAWASLIPAGTTMLFNQTTAPTGWTKVTTHNDKALRVVSGAVGSGGTGTFSTTFANRSLVGGGTNSVTVTGSVGFHTLTVDQMPSHSHTLTAARNFNNTAGGNGDVETNNQFFSTDPTGGSQGHNHSFTGGAHSHTVSGTIDMSVQYVDVIFATKDAY